MLDLDVGHFGSGLGDNNADHPCALAAQAVVGDLHSADFHIILAVMRIHSADASTSANCFRKVEILVLLI